MPKSRQSAKCHDAVQTSQYSTNRQIVAVKITLFGDISNLKEILRKAFTHWLFGSYLPANQPLKRRYLRIERFPIACRDAILLLKESKRVAFRSKRIPQIFGRVKSKPYLCDNFGGAKTFLRRNFTDKTIKDP
jgi:hypothetical protein